MKYLKIFENFKDTITLYHGTCVGNANNLIKNGWNPNLVSIGSNMGNPKYLYVSSSPEDALWFANQKGCDVVLEIEVTKDVIKPDPEDEDGFTLIELIDRMEKTKLPSKFIITKPISSDKISIKSI